MDHNEKKKVLINKDGKVVVIRVEEEDHLKLCAIDGQGEPETSVKAIIRKKNKRRQMAFIFHHDKTDYLTKVENTSLKLEETTDNISVNEIPESHWFEQVPVTDHYYCLQTVVAPRQYVALTQERPSSLILSDRNDMSAKVKLDYI